MSPAVIFDWGGVFMQTVDYGPRHKWDDKLGLEHGSVEQVVHGIDAWRDAQMGKISLDAYWKAVSDELEINAAETEQLRADFYAGDQLDADVVAVARMLERQRGVRVGLLSNNTLDLRDQITELGLDEVFDAKVISADIGAMKPNKRAYSAILKALNVSTLGTVLIDDFEKNIKGAEKAGIGGILFTPGMHLTTALAEWLTEYE